MMVKKDTKTIDDMRESEDRDKIVEYVRACMKEAKDASAQRRKAWKELWDVYQNKQDYRMKAEWQSKIVSPKVWMKVERAAAEVKRALLQLNKLFKFEIDDEREWSKEQKDILLKEKPRLETRFRRALEKSNLTNVYADMCKGAFLLGIGIPKVLWDYEGQRLNYQNVPVLNTYISPDYQVYENERPKYIIEEQEMDLAAFKLLVEKINAAAGREVYDRSEIDKLDEDFNDVEKRQADRKQRGFGQYEEVSKRVLLWQFWGDYITEEDGVVTENQLYIIVNKKYLVRRQDNPFKHGRNPHILTFPLPYPHRGIAGSSLVEPMVKILYTYNNLMNMFMDNMNWSVNKMFEYDPNRFVNPKKMMTIYPGKLLQKIGDGTAFTEVPITPVTREAIPGLEFLDRETQEATSVTEFLMSMPSRKAKTLGEVELKTAESKGLFDTIARDLEQNSIRPLLEMSYSLLVQYAGFEDITGKYTIKVGGLSLLLIQREQIEQVDSVIERMSKIPILAQMTNIGELWKKYLSILNLQDVYIDEADRQMPPEVVERQAEMDAERAVAAMSPQEIMSSGIRKAG